MTPPRTPLSAAPPWPTLAALVAAVLGSHLALMAGGLSLPAWAAAPTIPKANLAASVPGPESEPHAASSISAAAPVRASQVRWIVPAAPSLPAAAPPAPRKHTAARAAPPAPRAEMASIAPPKEAPQPLPDVPSPPPLAEDIEDSFAATGTAEASLPPPAEVVAMREVAVPAPAEPVPEAETASAAPAIAGDTPAENDELLLAAAPSGQARKPSAAASRLPPAQPPASTRLLYDVTGSVKGLAYKAQGTLDWKLTEGRYDANMEMRVMLLGSRSQTSTGRVGPTGLIPERFADKSRSEKAAHFDAAQQRIRFSSNAPEVPLQPGAQDRLSLFMQIAGLLQARPQAYAAGQTIDMQVAGTGDAPVWRFQLGEESTLALPAGEFRVRHLVRQPRKEFDSTVEMWLAPRLNHLPVRIRVTQTNGDVADQQLRQMP